MATVSGNLPTLIPSGAAAGFGAEIESGDGIYGTGDSDTLYGTSEGEYFYAGYGDDVLKGFGGADTLDGGPGRDSVFYGDSMVGVTINLSTGRGYLGSAEGDVLLRIENVYGSNHNDTLIGDSGANELHGQYGNDVLKGGGGDDGLYGEHGDDILKGGGGADHLDGGVGIDTVDYSSVYVYEDPIAAGGLAFGVHVDLRGFVGGAAAGDTFNSIENVTGSNYRDRLYGTDGPNAIRGLDYSDELIGYGGNDTLDGGNGDDRLVGGPGADTMIGGSGGDRYYVDELGDIVIEEYADGAGDTVQSLISYTLPTNVEHLVLGFGAINGTGNELRNLIQGTGEDNVIEGLADTDVLFGYHGNDTLNGGSGWDHMIGGAGSDTYYVDNAADELVESGGQGSDTAYTSVSWTITAGADVELLATTNDFGTAAINLTGNASGNEVRGNTGNNTLNGGEGHDYLTGLGGQDSFLFDTALDAASNVDRITDFNVAEDTILLDQTIFSSSLGLGNISAGEFVIGTAAQDANDRIIYNGNTGALFYDNDGVGGNAAIQFATLSTGLALTNLDFLVVA
jgi:Ca2+-binding RTX toxin-like protein